MTKSLKIFKRNSKNIGPRIFALISIAVFIVFCLFVIAKLGRVINPVPQISVAISKDGTKAYAVNKYGTPENTHSELIQNGAARIFVSGAPLGVAGDLTLIREVSGDLSIENSTLTSVVAKNNSVLMPINHDGYVVAKNPGLFWLSSWVSIFFVAIALVLILSANGIILYVNELISLWRLAFNRYDITLIIALLLAASLWPVGVDINVIARTVSYSNDGIDIYSAQIVKKLADNFPWPAFPYPPVTLSILSPLQWLSDSIITPFLLFATGRNVASSGIAIFGIFLYFSLTYAILAEFIKIGRLSTTNLRSSFYWAVLCPGTLYLVAGFQQIDIYGIAFLGFGLILMQESRARLFGAILIAVGLGVKPQNLIVAPVVIMYFLHRLRITDNIKDTLIELTSAFIVIVVYFASFFAATLPSYKYLIEGFSVVDRMGASIWIINPDNRIYSMPLFSIIAYSAIFYFWRSADIKKTHIGISAMVSMSIVICLYQASMVHNPGLSIFLLLGITPLMALIKDLLDRIAIALVSIMAVFSWPLSYPGDVTRLFSERGFNEILGGYAERFHEQYYSMLYSIEFIGLVLLGIILIGFLKHINRP